MARVKLFVTSFAMFLLLLAPTLTSAEGFIDLYAGVASTQDADVSVEEFSPFLAPAEVSRTVDFDTSVTFGVRVGYYRPGVPGLGIAFDVSSFQAENNDVDIALVPFSLLLMLRWPLFTSDELPQGRLQPYVGIGGGIFMADVEVDFGPTVGKASDSTADVGLDALLKTSQTPMVPRFIIMVEKE